MSMTNVDHMRLTRAERQKLTNKLHTLTDWLADTLNETVTRQTSHTTGPQISTGKHKEHPLPYHPTASAIAWDLENTLNAWAHTIATKRQLPPPTQRLTIKNAATWLAQRRHIDGLALIGEGPQAFDEICHAIDRATTIIDRPRQANYLGPCPDKTCDGELWAEPDDDPIPCRTCQTTTPRHTIDQRIDHELRNRLSTATELVDIIADRLGLTVKPATIHELTRRRRPLLVRGKLPSGEYLYRCGDVLDALIPRRKRTRHHQPTTQRSTSSSK